MNYQNKIDLNYYFARYNEILFNIEREMLVTSTTNNITIDFIRCMIPYNMAAIYMCENLNKYTNNLNMKNITNNIIENKKRQIDYMKQVFNNMMPYINSEKEVNNYFKKYFKIVNNMINNMINNMRNTQVTDNVDIIFTYQIISYFDGAIRICQNVIRYNIDPRIGDLANNIIIESSSMINMFRNLEYNLRNNMV